MIITIQCPHCQLKQKRNITLSYRTSDKFVCESPKCQTIFTCLLHFYQNKLTAFEELPDRLKSIRF